MIKRFHELRKSFTAKVITILVVTMVCMAVVFDFLLISMQKKNYHASHSAYGATLTQMLAHSVRLAVFVENVDEVADYVEGLLLQDDVVEVVIVGQDGQVILHRMTAATKSACIGSPEKLQSVLNSLENNEQLCQETKGNFIYWNQVSIDSSSNTEESWYFEDEDSKTEREVIGYVAVVLSKKYYDQGVRNILVQTGVAVLIFLFISIMATFIIIQRVTEPLRALMLLMRKNTGATAIPDDLDLITETYGSMIDDLEKSFATITELKDGLEETVHLRTEMLNNANEELSRRQVKLETSNLHLIKALSQLQDTQEQLVQKEKLAAMGQVVAGVAHEINNSVNFVSGALPPLHRCLTDMKQVVAGYEAIEKAQGTEVLDDTFETIRDLKEEIAFDELFSTIDQLMENMDEGTRRTTSIIKDLKTFSREDEERMSLINLNVVIDSSTEFIDKELLKNIKIIRDFGKIPYVTCLPGRISQVFINIIDNAIQAMDGEGQLTIKSRYKGDYVHIFFSDSGCGIAADDMPKIFDPFFTSKEVGKGTGLGLSISYSIIRQHGGDLKVKSEEGKDTVLEVVLPIYPVGVALDAS